jgi:hypothetical protein
VKIILDDNVVFNKNIKAGDFPEDVQIDLRNAIKFQIKVTAADEIRDYIEIGFFNARFIK